MLDVRSVQTSRTVKKGNIVHVLPDFGFERPYEAEVLGVRQEKGGNLKVKIKTEGSKLPMWRWLNRRHAHFGIFAAFTFRMSGLVPGARIHARDNRRARWKEGVIVSVLKEQRRLQVRFMDTGVTQPVPLSPSCVVMDRHHARLLARVKSLEFEDKAKRRLRIILEDLGHWRCNVCQKENEWTPAVDYGSFNAYRCERCKSDGRSRVVKCMVVSPVCQMSDAVAHAVPEFPAVITDLIGEYGHSAGVGRRPGEPDDNIFTGRRPGEPDDNIFTGSCIDIDALEKLLLKGKREVGVVSSPPPPPPSSSSVSSGPLLRYHVATGVCEELTLPESEQPLAEFIRKSAAVNKPAFPPFLDKYMKMPYLPKIPKIVRPKVKDLMQNLAKALKTSLFGYQLHTILWASNLEQRIRRGHRLVVGCKDLIYGPADFNCSILYDRLTRQFLPASAARVRHVTYRGGIIADETGLGKTATCIGLVACDLARGRGLKTQTETETEGGGWKGRRETPKDGVISTHATLVVCPNQLCSQWSDQAKRHSKDLKVFRLTTKAQHARPRSEMLNADIVVVSKQFLVGKHYNCLLAKNQTPSTAAWHLLTCSNCGKDFKDRDRLLKHHIKCVQKRKKRAIKPKSKEGFIMLHKIEFKRIILDEGHDYILENRIMRVINDIPSISRWYVSATPFPSRACIARVAEFLNITLLCAADKANEEMRVAVGYPEWERHIKRPLGSVLDKVIHQCLFSRLSKTLIGDENKLPEAEESVELLDCHPIERVFYRMLEVECRVKDEKERYRQERRGLKYPHLAIAIRDAGVKSEAESTAQRIARGMVFSSIGASRFAADDDDNYLSTLWRGILSRKQRDCARLREQFANMDPEETDESKSEYWLHKKLTEQLEVLNDPGLPEAIRAWNENNKSNPAILTQTPRLGTKLAHMLCYVQRTLADQRNRIVLFSATDMVLQKCGTLLKNLGIATVWCRGNVHARTKALRAFQHEKIDPAAPRVLMLSLEKAASGADLTKATHVLLLDPVAGMKNRAYAVETQAVGRAIRQCMDNDRPYVHRPPFQQHFQHNLERKNSTSP
uniref:Helicase ATP-binding domain-containing protein n=1 Tax=Lotharella globosa TaxID=91324 RepID=A0A7S3YZF0_9EUKA